MFFLLFSSSCHSDEAGRITEQFNTGWKFHLGEVPGAEAPDFDISSWRDVDLPHDWSIEDIPGTNSPFDSASVGGRGTGYAVGGTAWYAKEFVLDESFSAKNVELLFEGIYMNSDVWINGYHLGNHAYGYTSFYYQIGEYLHFDGRPNRLMVEVKNVGANSRWYSGSGIYRHVWLTAKSRVHLKRWGTYIATRSADTRMAEIRVETALANEREMAEEVVLEMEVKDSGGLICASASVKVRLGAKSDTSINQLIKLEAPALWSPGSPKLYTLVSTLYSGKRILDKTETNFGIRTAEFDAEKGFLLNGEVVKLKGACVHHDNGPLGAASYDRAEERKVELMKNAGFNAIRTAHNPPSPGFLDACDRLGVLVINEIYDGWFDKSQKKPYYQMEFEEGWPADVRDFVLRDRNHPSVILWSTGNEIFDKMAPRAVKAQEEIAALIRRLDPSRALTCGMNEWGYDDWDQVMDEYMAPLDVAGYNYRESKYLDDYKKHPERLIVCSESFPGKAFPYWMEVLEHDFVIGDFVWTGLDYLGEGSIGWYGFTEKYPWTLAYCGDIDICGFKRSQSYYRDILWENGRKVALFVKNPVPTFGIASDSWWDYPDIHPSWTWPGYEGDSMEVTVYSNSEEVALILNGEVLGTAKTSRANEYTAIFHVPYEAGILEASAMENNMVIEHSVLKTAGPLASISISSDRDSLTADGKDLAYLSIELLDAQGTRLPFAEELIEFNLEGPGEIIAVGSARPNSLESFQQARRTSFEGRCIVIVKAGNTDGEIRLTASTGELESSTYLTAYLSTLPM